MIQKIQLAAFRADYLVHYEQLVALTRGPIPEGELYLPGFLYPRTEVRGGDVAEIRVWCPRTEVRGGDVAESRIRQVWS